MSSVSLTLSSNEYPLTVVDGTALTLSLSGPTGPAGPAGPNTVSTSTSTNLTGYIYGNGTTVGGATAATSAATANTLVLRNASGDASFGAINASSTIITTGDDATITTSGVGAYVSTFGADAFISTSGTNASISTSGSNADIFTVGDDATISTEGANASIITTGTDAYIATTGINSAIFTQGTNATIGTTGADAFITTSGINAAIRTFGNFGNITTSGTNAYITTSGINAPITTSGADAHIATYGADAYIQSRATFKLFNGTYTTTLSHSPTADRAIAFPNASGTVALINPSSGTQTFSGSQSFSSTTRPTSSGTGTPASNSLVTRLDLGIEAAINRKDFLRGTWLRAAFTGTGSINSQNAYGLLLYAANSSGAGSLTVSPRISTGISEPTFGYTETGAPYGIASFAGRMVIGIEVASGGGSGFDHTTSSWAFSLGALDANPTAEIETLYPTNTNVNRGYVAIKCVNGAVSLVTQNGNQSVMSSADIDTLPNYFRRNYVLLIEAGTVSLFRGRDIIGNISGAPSADVSGITNIWFNATNTAAAAINQTRLYINNVTMIATP